MQPVPLQTAILLAAILFALGLAGVLIRRNLLFMLMSIEIMLNAAGLAFVAAGARWGQPDGQIMFLLVLTLAAAEISVGLALILLLQARRPTLDADSGNRLKG
jgi:NADH-quinone oxidoreductase subunit K